MNIQFNTDSNISGNEKLAAYISSTIDDELKIYRDQITRIEVHLSDETGDNNGQNNKRCMLEARLENIDPIAVTSHSNSIEESLSAALDKLKSSIKTILGRLNNH
tara:strand:+ start:7527 stop:7841 length:315 start_codon:yes stop_codon:yes gene_type:complete